MNNLNINTVSAVICLIVLVSVVRGILNNFISEDMFNSISSALNSIFFLVSFPASIYITVKLFAALENMDFSRTYGRVFRWLASYKTGKEIILYIVFIPVITIALLYLLGLIKSIFDKPLKAASDHICRIARGTGKYTRAFLGITLELPRAAARIIIVVFLISLLTGYYPVGTLASIADGSRVYNYINSYAVSPIINSSIGRSIPFFLQESVGVLSENLEESTVFQKSDTLKYLGFLRFQIETKSNEAIDLMARKVVGNEKDERKKAHLLYNWIGNHLSYDWEKYNNLVNGINNVDKFGAIQAFETRKGVCEDYSDLYVAMARAAGLKVRIIIGQGYTNNQWGGHAWNEVYIPDEGKWIPLDTTWAKAGNYFDNKDFSRDHVFEAVAGEW